jgi:amphi-Trp domain-containing protein
MSKPKGVDEFKHDSLQDRESIVRYLEALVNGFRTGKLYFASGKQELVLRPQGLLHLGLQVKRKDDQNKVSLKISWRQPKSSEPPQDPLVIGPEGSSE